MAHTILIVEDERALLDAVQEKLANEGFRVQTAQSEQEALDIMRRESVDVVWLDHYLLGQKTGLEFVGELKGNDTWKTIPIFVVSNTAGPDKVQTYLQLGVDKYYIKAKTRLDEVIRDIKQLL